MSIRKKDKTGTMMKLIFKQQRLRFSLSNSVFISLNLTFTPSLFFFRFFSVLIVLSYVVQHFLNRKQFIIIH